jgi:deoxycytidine triphosphate deaminase
MRIIDWKYTNPEKPASSSFALIWTAERIRLPNYISAEIEGKSKWARIGAAMHPSSGKVDPKFDNEILLEVKNIDKIPHTIFPGDPVAELVFSQLDRPTKMGYTDRPDSSYKNGNSI